MEQLENAKPELISITEAHYTTGYSIEMTFNDNTSRTINFEPFLLKSVSPQVNKYLDKGKFKKFHLIEGNLNWHNYELTFPLADLYAGVI
ncbi:MAG: DUF2442 domain-containing protein [Ignavibacteria bacterium]|nr:DUF2442 domain-containing protein [Ignavibacteria bacterium]